MILYGRDLVPGMLVKSGKLNTQHRRDRKLIQRRHVDAWQAHPVWPVVTRDDDELMPGALWLRADRGFVWVAPWRRYKVVVR